jgi:hypothetical protein
VRVVVGAGTVGDVHVRDPLQGQPVQQTDRITAPVSGVGVDVLDPNPAAVLDLVGERGGRV